MFDLFLFGLQHLIVSLVFWVAAFVLVAVATALPVTSWALGRIKNVRASGIVVGDGRMFLLSAAILLLSYVAPMALAVVHAVPFAVGRSVARTLEQSTPKAADWIVDLAGTNVAAVLHVAGEQVLLDVDDLRGRVADALIAAGDTTKSYMGPGRIRELAVNISLAALIDVLDGLAPGVDRVTWNDLLGKVKSTLGGGSSLVMAETVIGLRAAAWGAVFTGLMLLAACHLFTILLFILAVRPPRPAATG